MYGCLKALSVGHPLQRVMAQSTHIQIPMSASASSHDPSAAQSDSTRAPHQAQTRGGPTAGRAFAIARAVVHGRSQPVARAVCSIATTSETPAASVAGQPVRAGGRRGDSRSVMPSDALGRTRATLAGPAGVREDVWSPRRGRDRGLERPRAPGMSCRRAPPPRAGRVPAPCTHRPSLLPTGRGGERPGPAKGREPPRLEEGEVVTRYP